MCGMVMTVQDGRITDVRADKDDVFSRGYICPKGPAMREVLEDPDRLRQPVRRTKAGWQRIGWEEALSEVASRIADIQARYGKNAVGFYAGNPSLHNYSGSITMLGFAGALGTQNLFDSNSVDANPKLFSSMLMFGDRLSLLVPDVDRTDYLLILGANPAASNGSLMSLGDVRGRLRGIQARGGRIVVIDPRRTETAAWADEHHFIRPGGDAAFLLALIHVLFAAGRIDEPRVGEHTTGLRELRALAERFSPERVAPAVGIPAATIRSIALSFATAPRAVAYGRLGTCQNEFGPVVSWLVDALNVITGNFDRPGGAMFPRPAVDTSRIGRMLIGNTYAGFRSRVRGLPEFAGYLPAAAMAEEMDTPGDGQIRALITLAGNPALTMPNSERMVRALAGLDFMVSIDLYLNETTRHAQLVLPPLHALERDHFDLIFHAFAVRNTVKHSPPVVAPPAGALDDWEILYELGMRLGGLRFGVGLLDRLARRLWRHGVRVPPSRLIDLLLRVGPYGDKFLPLHPGLNLARVGRQKHGIDLGPLVPAGKQKLHTPDRRVHLAPELLLRDAARLDGWVDRRPEGSLVLIGRRHLRSNNSWMHNVKSLTKGPDRTALLIHPEDGRRLGFSDGAAVRVRSRVGAVNARLEYSDAMMKGVLSLPHGYGHAAAADTLQIAGALPGPSVNVLTDEGMVEPLLGTAVLNGVPVTLEALSAAE